MLTLTCFLFASCQYSYYEWKRAKEHTDDKFIFDGSNLISKLTEINDFGNDTIVIKEFTIETFLSGASQDSKIYILKDNHTGKYSPLVEYKISIDSSRFELPTFHIQKDTKEILMKELNEKSSRSPYDTTKTTISNFLILSAQKTGALFIRK